MLPALPAAPAPACVRVVVSCSLSAANSVLMACIASACLRLERNDWSVTCTHPRCRKKPTEAYLKAPCSCHFGRCFHLLYSFGHLSTNLMLMMLM